MTLLGTAPLLLGGLGLFLLGMGLMSDGLRLAAGGALRGILARSTRTRARGLGAGVLVTALLQSSSAVTVAVIGFVNAGLLGLGQAVWVVFGSNVGTTMTGWLVALVGFKLKIEAFALPLVGVGMILRLTGAGTRRASWGLALVGFGLLFLGIETLKQVFDGLGSDVSLPALVGGGPMVLVVYLAAGVALTTLMQSSSAALVVALAAAEGGLVPLGAGAALVIGANVGTTSTALLSVWGATPPAKRVAMAHVAFNVLTGALALALLYPMLALADWLRDALGLARSPAASLAAFHTLFNCLGVVLMLPLGEPLVRWLSRRFRRAEEDTARPRFLDRSALAVPHLALDALDRELDRVRGLTASLLLTVLTPAGIAAARAGAQCDAVQALVGACRDFAAALGRTALPGEVAGALADRLRAGQHYANACRAALEIAALADSDAAAHAAADAAPGDDDLPALRADLDRLARAVVEMSAGGDPAMLAEAEGAMKEAYERLKSGLLGAGAAGRVDVVRMDRALERSRLVRYVAERLVKAARRMQRPAGGAPSAVAEAA